MAFRSIRRSDKDISSVDLLRDRVVGAARVEGGAALDLDRLDSDMSFIEKSFIELLRELPKDHSSQSGWDVELSRRLERAEAEGPLRSLKLILLAESELPRLRLSRPFLVLLGLCEGASKCSLSSFFSSWSGG